jgi:hypothetical protein
MKSPSPFRRFAKLRCSLLALTATLALGALASCGSQTHPVGHPPQWTPGFKPWAQDQLKSLLAIKEKQGAPGARALSDMVTSSASLAKPFSPSGHPVRSFPECSVLVPQMSGGNPVVPFRAGIPGLKAVPFTPAPSGCNPATVAQAWSADSRPFAASLSEGLGAARGMGLSEDLACAYLDFLMCIAPVVQTLEDQDDNPTDPRARRDTALAQLASLQACALATGLDQLQISPMTAPWGPNDDQPEVRESGDETD